MATDKGYYAPGVETEPAHVILQNDRKSADVHELDGRAHSDESANPHVLEHGIATLESKKTVWYAYLTTKDFWIVLAIG